MKKLLYTGIITGLLFSSLQASIISKIDETQVDVANGAQVWADTCMRCHNLRAPSDLSKLAWRFSMQHMRVRAGLTGQDTRDVLAFILDSKTTE
ncbi:hypothetical protein JHD48_03920, partial [Sulfurimonas sp. SAG-AH-194-I05]